MLVRQSGQPCRTVQRSFFQGLLEQQHAVWSISCSPREDYAIVFYADAANSTRVLKCAELKAALGVPRCFARL
jgi:hypothetical protein